MKVEVWIESIDKMKNKMHLWGMKWLNLVGRTTLIKYIIYALPLYQYTIVQALAGTQKQIELLIRKFL